MKDTAIQVANLMAASARTAPKAGGKDFLEIAVISREEDLQRIAQAMRDYAPKSSNQAYWLRDAENIANCQALVLVGLAGSPTAGYDCGACGHATCKDFAQGRAITDTPMGYSGPHCVMRMMDIGCALASAAKTASLLNLDNRVQQRVGAAARALGFIEASVAMGIPVGFHGKSIYFDRSAPKH
ncbi:MAG: ferredoxin domain-containing protein [Acidobacteriota bacterium]